MRTLQNRQPEYFIEKAKVQFFEMVDNFGSDPYHLFSHVPEAEKWAKFMLSKYPQADKEVVLITVWLHDIGHYPIPTDIDHAIRSEERARKFLKDENYEIEKMERVLHGVRAHRCRDVMPATLEAKIMAFVDSASYMTDTMYLDMCRDDKRKGEDFRVYAKMEWDMRDLSSFPEVQQELVGLFNAWKVLINEYEKIDLI